MTLNIGQMPKHLMKLPEAEQASFVRHITQLVNDVFIITADEDYFNARWLAHSKMHRAFFWSASQAIEKYLKAHLLFRGVPLKDHKEYGHNIKSMWCELYGLLDADEQARIGRTLILSEQLLSKLAIYGAALDIQKECLPVNFIDLVEKYGSPSNRYDYFCIFYKIEHLFFLDLLVFQLRRLLVDVDIVDSLHKFPEYEDVLFRHNYAFAPAEFVHIDLVGLSLISLRNSEMSLALSGCFGRQDFYEEWIKSNIKIGKHEIIRLKNIKQGAGND